MSSQKGCTNVEVFLENGLFIYQSRFGKIKETHVDDITKIEVNRYARIRVFCKDGKVFLSRNLWEYPGMMDLVAVFRDNKRIFEFQDEDTEKQFWSMR